MVTTTVIVVGILAMIYGLILFFKRKFILDERA